MVVFGVIVFIVLEVLWCLLWRDDKNDPYSGITLFEGSVIAFLAVPFVSIAISVIVYLLLKALGFWLIPIVLFIAIILSIVYKEEICNFFKKED